LALKRLIPCLLFDGNGLVKTVRFAHPSYIGDPINAIKIFNEKEVDELILIDINASRQGRRPRFEQIADFASEAFMPFAYGGGVKTYDDFARLYKSGVEKVIVNSLIQEDPEVIKNVIVDYGAQAVVGCIDFKKKPFRGKVPVSYAGNKIRRTVIEYARYLDKEIGVGELMLQSVDRDGTWSGYDEETTAEVIREVNVPVIACGGCGSIRDLESILYNVNASAAAVGSMAVYSRKGMGVLINFPIRERVIKE
jgi:imidazole glycerol-phosphate synthase subunit HisF